MELSSEISINIDKTHQRIAKFQNELKVVPDESMENKFDLVGKNLRVELLKRISKITVHNIPLTGIPFNQRKDNIAYRLEFTVIAAIESEDYKVVCHISSRDKRLFTEDWQFSGYSYENAQKIKI